jgi:AcrR family transcriptional regulator
MKTNPNALLQIAFREFLRKGFEQTSMRDLVTASGLSKGAFHHYYPRKADLLEACIHHYFSRFLPDLDATPYTHFAELVLECADQYGNLLIELDRQEIDLSGYHRFVWSILPTHRDTFLDRQRQLDTRLKELAEQDQQNNRLTTHTSPEQLSLQAMAMIEGLGVLWAATPSTTKTDPRLHFRQTCEAWLKGLMT